MSTSLAADIVHDTTPLPLAGDGIDPGAIAVQIEAEQCRIQRPGSPLVERGWNGTDATSHSSGTTVTPLYRTLSSTPGGA